MLVVVPTLAPALFASTVIAFLVSFGEVTVTAFLTTARMLTLPVRIYADVQLDVEPTVNVISVLTIAVTVLALAAINRFVDACGPHAPLGSHGQRGTGPPAGLGPALKHLLDVAGLVTGTGTPALAGGRAPAAAVAPALAALRMAAARQDPEGVAAARDAQAGIAARMAAPGAEAPILLPVGPGIAPPCGGAGPAVADVGGRAPELMCTAGHAGLPKPALPALPRLEGLPGLGPIGAAGSEAAPLAEGERL